jgi:hypothetical protein
MFIWSNTWQSWEIFARHNLMVFWHLLFNYLKTLKFKNKIYCSWLGCFIFHFTFCRVSLIIFEFHPKMEQLKEYSLNFPVWNFVIIHSLYFEFSFSYLKIDGRVKTGEKPITIGNLQGCQQSWSVRIIVRQILKHPIDILCVYVYYKEHSPKGWGKCMYWGMF